MKPAQVEKPWHRTAAWTAETPDPFPKPGTKWRPLYRPPHIDSKPVSIRRFIARSAQIEESKK